MKPRTDTSKKERRQGTCACCIVFWIIIILLLGILYFSLYQPQNPDVQLQTIQLDSIALGGYPNISSVNVSLSLLVLVNNPNRAVFFYSSSTAYLYHSGFEVGYALIPAGQIQDQEAVVLSVNLTVESFTLMQGVYLDNDVEAGSLTLATSTIIGGHVTVLGMFTHHALTASNCTVNISFSTRNIDGHSCNDNIELQ